MTNHTYIAINYQKENKQHYIAINYIEDNIGKYIFTKKYNLLPLIITINILFIIAAIITFYTIFTSY